jgi:polyhydroxyalkanoate synthesis regulator phasin
MGRKNTLTRFLEDIVDDTKDFVDDLIDRTKDIEENVKDAVTDVVDDDDGEQPSTDVAALQASLAALKAKVEELTALSAKTAPAK